uniref:Uncharacterized protein n=1 Tax=Strigamia maritima TaxID=126957 RepID=T1IXR1_STRMM
MVTCKKMKKNDEIYTLMTLFGKNRSSDDQTPPHLGADDNMKKCEINARPNREFATVTSETVPCQYSGEKCPLPITGAISFSSTSLLDSFNILLFGRFHPVLRVKFCLCDIETYRFVQKKVTLFTI